MEDLELSQENAPEPPAAAEDKELHAGPEGAVAASESEAAQPSEECDLSRGREGAVNPEPRELVVQPAADDAEQSGGPEGAVSAVESEGAQPSEECDLSRGREGAVNPEPRELVVQPAADDAEHSGGPEGAVDAGPGETAAAAGQMVIDSQPATTGEDDTGLKAVVEAIVYVAEEPVSAAQIAAALQQPEESIARVLDQLMAEYARPAHGLMIREVAGGFKMTTKPEHHEAIRAFVKSLKPPLKLSLAALETLATIAYKQPITAPEIMEIRGVQGAGVLKTLLDRKLIQTSGRKNVIGRPILYRTTKEFLVQFGLKDLSELPTLKEFEELRRLAVSEPEPEAPAETAAEPAAVVPTEAETPPAAEADAPAEQAKEPDA
jgi:segregation and condensation protein B